MTDQAAPVLLKPSKQRGLTWPSDQRTAAEWKQRQPGLRLPVHEATRGRCKLPCEVTAGWLPGAPLTAGGAAVAARVAASAPVGTPVEPAACVPPGAGVAEPKGPPFVGLTPTVEVAPGCVAP